MPYTSGSILFTNFVPVFILFPPRLLEHAVHQLANLLFHCLLLPLLWNISSARNSGLGDAAPGARPLGSSLTETLVELS